MEEGHSGLTTTSPHTGTERYLAPELLHPEALPTTFSDVYALGCIGMEVRYHAASWLYYFMTSAVFILPTALRSSSILSTRADCQGYRSRSPSSNSTGTDIHAGK